MRLIMKKQIWRLIWLSIILVVTILLTSMAFFNYSLIIGWLVGLCFSFINCYINYIIIKKWLLKNKKNGFWRALVKANLFLIVSLIFLIGIIMINKLFHGMTIFQNDLKLAFGPINIFVFLGGFTIGQWCQLDFKIKKTEFTHGRI